MKNLCAITLSIATFFFSSFTNIKPLSSVLVVPEIPYAQINQNAILYSDQALSQIITSLPKTYFVSVLETMENAYKVSFLDLDGYMNKSDVTLVDFEPSTKFATSTLTPNNDGLPINLRSSPNHTLLNKLCEIENDTTLTYYGQVEGTALIPQIGDLWYYVKYTSTDGAIYGYVYSGHVLAKPFIANSFYKVTVEQDDDDISPPIFAPEQALYIVIITALCIPAVLIMLMLFKKPPKKRIPRHFDE